jgi:inosose dehydratase
MNGQGNFNLNYQSICMKVANAPCSWGVLEFGLDGTTDSYDKVLDEMQITGYKGSELGDWGFMPCEPERLKKELQNRGLNLVGAFVPVNFVDQQDHAVGKSEALKIAQLLSQVDPDHAKIVLSDENGKNPIRTRNAGRITRQHGLSSSQWKTFAYGVNETARAVFEKTGVESVFHHHCAGFVETPEEIEFLMDLTNPEFVNLCFDTGHYAFGGGDPVNGLKTLADRVKHVHFKDWDRSVFDIVVKNDWDYFQAVGKGIFCELGKGSIDFNAILEELENQNYTDWIVVEQDILPGMGSPKESAHRNREFLRSVGV